MQRLSKTVTMYHIPSESSEVRVVEFSGEHVLSYLYDETERQVPLLRGHLPSKLICVNKWNTAAFISTELPPVVFTFPFGKHAGKRVEEVPSRYVEWWMENILQDSPTES